MIQYRLEALKGRPELLEAIRRVGKPSACGKFIEVDPSKTFGLAAAHKQVGTPPAELADRVELGLCGRHREAWAAAGRPLRTPEQNKELKALCEACDARWRGMDKALCRQQPCTTAGRWAATYECPAAKWPDFALWKPRHDA